MSLSALIAITKAMDDKYKERFNGRVPRNRKIVGYSKGHWLVEYTFSIQGGYSIESHWEQDARSIAHHQKHPLD
jgi:hypothetical protein